jgi:hypothetical protein
MDRIGHTTDSVCLLFVLGRPPSGVHPTYSTAEPIDSVLRVLSCGFEWGRAELGRVVE